MKPTLVTLLAIALVGSWSACGGASPAEPTTEPASEPTGVAQRAAGSEADPEPQREAWVLAARQEVVSDTDSGIGMVITVTLTFLEDGIARTVEVERYDLDCRGEGCGHWDPLDPGDPSELTQTAAANMPSGTLASVLLFHDSEWRAYHCVSSGAGVHVTVNEYADQTATTPEVRRISLELAAGQPESL